jgi:hypothetical protein
MIGADKASGANIVVFGARFSPSLTNESIQRHTRSLFFTHILSHHFSLITLTNLKMNYLLPILLFSATIVVVVLADALEPHGNVRSFSLCRVVILIAPKVHFVSV